MPRHGSESTYVIAGLVRVPNLLVEDVGSQYCGIRCTTDGMKKALEGSRRTPTAQQSQWSTASMLARAIPYFTKQPGPPGRRKDHQPAWAAALHCHRISQQAAGMTEARTLHSSFAHSSTLSPFLFRYSGQDLLKLIPFTALRATTGDVRYKSRSCKTRCIANGVAWLVWGPASVVVLTRTLRAKNGDGGDGSHASAHMRPRRPLFRNSSL